MLKKILERCCLKYKLIKYVTCPSTFFLDKENSEENLKHLLKYFYENNLLQTLVAEKANTQYKDLISNKEFSNACSVYCFTEKRLDVFFSEWVGNNPEYQELWYVIKYVLMLSHGNATVESGFSVNKNILVENLHEKFLVAQRQVYDTIKHLGAVTELALNNKIRKCVQNTYKSYMEFLKREKQKSKEIDRLKLEKKRMKVKFIIWR